jgi:hypothetical protein
MPERAANVDTSHGFDESKPMLTAQTCSNADAVPGCNLCQRSVPSSGAPPLLAAPAGDLCAGKPSSVHFFLPYFSQRPVLSRSRS